MIYSSYDPNVPLENCTLEESEITGTNWSEPAYEEKKFYIIRSSSE